MSTLGVFYKQVAMLKIFPFCSCRHHRVRRYSHPKTCQKSPSSVADKLRLAGPVPLRLVNRRCQNTTRLTSAFCPWWLWTARDGAELLWWRLPTSRPNRWLCDFLQGKTAASGLVQRPLAIWIWTCSGISQSPQDKFYVFSSLWQLI